MYNNVCRYENFDKFTQNAHDPNAFISYCNVYTNILSVTNGLRSNYIAECVLVRHPVQAYDQPPSCPSPGGGGVLIFGFGMDVPQQNLKAAPGGNT